MALNPSHLSSFPWLVAPRIPPSPGGQAWDKKRPPSIWSLETALLALSEDLHMV